MKAMRKVIPAALLTAFAMSAQAADNDTLLQELRKLSARIEALEAKNAALEKALGDENMRDSDPALASRLKSVESRTAVLKEKSGVLDALDGIAVEGNFVAVGQKANSAAIANGTNGSEITWRGDLTIEAPAGSGANHSGKVFAHLRAGQGNGVQNGLGVSTYSNNINSTAFELAGAAGNRSDSTVLLAQAWYQLDYALGEAGQDSKRRMELTLGKIDPFLFFDQNGIADDETTRFLNNAFVHNPLLDSGGDVGVDNYGFSPGVRFAYVDEGISHGYWGASVATFGSGNGATFQSSFHRPFIIAQLETGGRLLGGREGNYRLYAWRNPKAADFDSTTTLHTGWGVSADQMISDNVTLFARAGSQGKGRVKFDEAFTLGGEINGGLWHRGNDAFGIAFGNLKTSADYAAGSLAQDGYQANGSEKITELYYRWQVNDAFEITPDFQWVNRPAGNSASPTAKAFAVRAKVSF